MTIRSFIANFLIIVSLFCFVGCDGDTKKLGTGNAESASTALIPDESGFYIKMTKNTNSAYEYLSHTLVGGIGVDSDWSNSCKVTASQFNTSEADVVCVAEVPELDLHQGGLNIQYNVPSGVCEYLARTPYFYFKYRPGTAAMTNVTCDTVPTCAYDYTASGGPNCCTGTWTTTAVCGTGPVQTGTFDGSFAACYGGPGVVEEESEGYPKTTIHDITSGVGLAGIYKVTPPMDMEPERKSNLYIANYYNPTDHTNITNNSWADLGVEAPIAFNVFTDTDPDLPKAIDYVANPFYTFECLDKHYEVKARIRLMVREWNSSNVEQGGNPDASGTEPNFPSNYNDFMDWKDLFQSGTDQFPRTDE